MSSFAIVSELGLQLVTSSPAGPVERVSFIRFGCIDQAFDQASHFRYGQRDQVSVFLGAADPARTTASVAWANMASVT